MALLDASARRVVSYSGPGVSRSGDVDEQGDWIVQAFLVWPSVCGKAHRGLPMKTSDSVWHEKLSRLDVETEDNPYDKAFCPDSVGSDDQIGSELAHDPGAGFTTFILDVPPDRGGAAPHPYRVRHRRVCRRHGGRNPASPANMTVAGP